MRRCIWNAEHLCALPGQPRVQENTKKEEAGCIFPVGGACFPGLSACSAWGCCCGRRVAYRPKRIIRGLRVATRLLLSSGADALKFAPPTW